MSMMKFSGIARLQIMAILNEKAKGKTLDPEHVTATSVYKKIYISDKQQEEELSYPVPEGSDLPPQLNPMKVRNMEILKVHLDYEELTVLNKVLRDFSGIRPLDHDLWLDDVLAQLEAAKNVPLQDEKVREQNLTELKKQNRR